MTLRLPRYLLLACLVISWVVVAPQDSSANIVHATVSGPSWSSCPTPLVGAQFSAPGTAARTVALTFDDGPGPSTTQIVAILNSFHVRATFFNIGANETRWPQDVVAEATDGYLLADHTWSHPDLVTLSGAQQRDQLAAVGAEQRALVGSSPCSFRPPYGDYDATTSAEAQSLSLSTWMWSVDTEDWQAEGSAASSWVQRIVSLAESEGGSQDHPIVLMHNQSIPMPATVAALPTIIEFFLARHYTFVDLLGRSGPPNACAATTAAFAPSARTYLAPHRALHAGESLRSPNGQYTLSQDANGTLSLVTSGRVMWSTPTKGHPRSSARVGAAGELEVISVTGRVLWHSASGSRGDRLGVGDDGSVSLVSASHTWPVALGTARVVTAGHALGPNWQISTANAACRLVMEPSGRLVVQSAANATLWTSRGVAAPGSSAVLESNGDLEIVSRAHQVLWASGSLGPHATLTLSSVGRAVVQGATGHWLWSTP